MTSLFAIEELLKSLRKEAEVDKDKLTLVSRNNTFKMVICYHIPHFSVFIVLKRNDAYINEKNRRFKEKESVNCRYKP
jgi:hypothetical protein